MSHTHFKPQVDAAEIGGIPVAVQELERQVVHCRARGVEVVSVQPGRVELVKLDIHCVIAPTLPEANLESSHSLYKYREQKVQLVFYKINREQFQKV